MAPDFFDYIFIDEYSATPKYLQLVTSILDAVEAGRIKKDHILPSINDLSNELEISRDTVEKSYKHLKKLGVIGSFPGRGYFLIKDDFRNPLKIVLLFNKLSAHKKIIYDCFIKKLGPNITVDFYIYNNDYALFKKLLINKLDSYSHYVIIPHFIEGGENAHEVINAIAKEKLVLLDKLMPNVDGDYAAVYENFERDIFGALDKAREALSKYHTIKLLFPKNSYYPKEIIKGFYKFCQQYAFQSKLVSDIETEPIEAGEVYVILMEDDLVKTIEKVLALKLALGKDVGVISYNETPIKKIILNGITTISTDFALMGETAAEIILDRSKKHVEIPFYLNLRQSL